MEGQGGLNFSRGKTRQLNREYHQPIDRISGSSKKVASEREVLFSPTKLHFLSEPCSGLSRGLCHEFGRWVLKLLEFFRGAILWGFLLGDRLFIVRR